MSSDTEYLSKNQKYRKLLIRMFFFPTNLAQSLTGRLDQIEKFLFQHIFSKSKKWRDEDEVFFVIQDVL